LTARQECRCRFSSQRPADTASPFPSAPQLGEGTAGRLSPRVAQRSQPGCAARVAAGRIARPSAPSGGPAAVGPSGPILLALVQSLGPTGHSDARRSRAHAPRRGLCCRPGNAPKGAAHAAPFFGRIRLARLVRERKARHVEARHHDGRSEGRPAKPAARRGDLLQCHLPTSVIGSPGGGRPLRAARPSVLHFAIHRLQR